MSLNYGMAYSGQVTVTLYFGMSIIVLFYFRELSYQETISLHLDDRAFFRCGISLSVYTLGDPLF